MSNIEEIADISERVINKAEKILSWFYGPKEEARTHLVKLIDDNKILSPQEKESLRYNSRKLVKEYGNAKAIYEQAKAKFNMNENTGDIEEDWLHFFFDKAEKASNRSMQLLWARMLAGEFNKPGSISRKLMHIISIMDTSSAQSFQTLCSCIFSPKTLFKHSFNMDVVLLPKGFYNDSFSFMKKVETWLSDAGFPDYKALALKLTMTNGELNSLENLGLIQQVPNNTSRVTLVYYLDDNRVLHFIPQNDAIFPLGQYSLTSEGQQLADVINSLGKNAIGRIVEQYLLSLDVSFVIEEHIGKKEK